VSPPGILLMGLPLTGPIVPAPAPR
jgi:hypothetical protein